MVSSTARLVYLTGLASVAVAQSATIPDYVLEYAPLVYMDVNEEYFPSDIAAQVANTYPALNSTRLNTAENNGPADLTLDDLTVANDLAGCTSFNNCGDLYLTSTTTITDMPTAAWLRGVEPNPSTGETEDATTCAVIVNDHGNNTVDAYYMFFYAWNQGVPVGSPNGTAFGNHVGDWEHMAIRFDNGEPVSVYYSIHSGGEAYSYDATLKNGSRPLGFSSKGGHATYAQEGIHVMFAGAANDSTSRGPLWDPVAGSGAWYYTFTPESASNFSDFNGTFEAVDVPDRTARGTGPTDWLYFFGHWGDQQYNESYPGQVSLGGLTSVFTGGPTGPLDKDLYRSQICPDRAGSANACNTMTSVQAAVGSTPTQTVSRPVDPAATTTSTGPAGSATGSTSGSGGGGGPATPTNAASSTTQNASVRLTAAVILLVMQLTF